MNIEEVDRWLKDQYGISYTELGNEFNGASELLSKKYKEIERLNNIINEFERIFKLDIEHLNKQEKNADMKIFSVIDMCQYYLDRLYQLKRK